MKQGFEAVISSYLNSNVGTSTRFLSKKLSTQLKGNLELLLNQNKLHKAGIGRTKDFIQNKNIRSDSIYWLDRQHNDIHENNFFNVIDAFVKYLNTSCYAGITSYEFHYAHYDTGSSYTKHLDQFKSNTSRAFSMIMYLNSEWVAGDGGELCVYQNGKAQLILPLDGTCVFFKSSLLEHEVLFCNKPRMSITGWFKTS